MKKNIGKNWYYNLLSIKNSIRIDLVIDFIINFALKKIITGRAYFNFKHL